MLSGAAYILYNQMVAPIVHTMPMPLKLSGYWLVVCLVHCATVVDVISVEGFLLIRLADSSDIFDFVFMVVTANIAHSACMQYLSH